MRPMGKKILLPAAALLGGGAGYALRRWQLSTGFEPDTGLAIPGVPAAVALVVCTAVVALLALALCWSWKGGGECESAFAGARDNTLFVTAAVAAGVLFLAGAVLEVPGLQEAIAQAQTGENALTRAAGRILPPLRIVLGALAAPCAILWGRALFRGEAAMKENVGLLELCLLLCVSLVSDYQKHSADPVMMNYAYEVLAMVCVLLALYYLAGYSFQSGKPRRCLFFCVMGCYFSLVALADGGSLPRMMNYGAAAVFLLAHGTLLRSVSAAETEQGQEEGEAQSHG